jgi:condensin complex subunit 1
LELVCNEENILGKFHALTAFIVADATKLYSQPLLRETAILTLCRYMSVSSVLCEKYLPLFFTVLERENSEAIRTSMVIAAGDLCFRFPNSLEPWTAHMYSRLTDANLLVRYNTLMVLTHLILNDMIKVKGQVSSMVLCLTDQSEKVRSLARLFFTELSKRSNNPVYNLLGDVISNLSLDNEDDGRAPGEVKQEEAMGSAVLPMAAALSRQLTSEEFTNTMHFLLSFVTKDR